MQRQVINVWVTRTISIRSVQYLGRVIEVGLKCINLLSYREICPFLTH